MSDLDLRGEFRRIDELQAPPPNYKLAQIWFSEAKLSKKAKWYYYSHFATFLPDEVKTLNFLPHFVENKVYAAQPYYTPLAKGLKNRPGKTLFLFSIKVEGGVLIPHRMLQKPPKKL
jgi:hypothetical protein